MQRPEAGTVAEEEEVVEEAAEEAAGEVEASVTAEVKAVPWAVREVVREAAPKVRRRLEVREAFQPASPRERLPPVLEGGRLQGRSVNRSPSPEARLAACPEEERGSRS